MTISFPPAPGLVIRVGNTWPTLCHLVATVRGEGTVWHACYPHSYVYARRDGAGTVVYSLLPDVAAFLTFHKLPVTNLGMAGELPPNLLDPKAPHISTDKPSKIVIEPKSAIPKKGIVEGGFIEGFSLKIGWQEPPSIPPHVFDYKKKLNEMKQQFIQLHFTEYNEEAFKQMLGGADLAVPKFPDEPMSAKDLPEDVLGMLKSADSGGGIAPWGLEELNAITEGIEDDEDDEEEP